MELQARLRPWAIRIRSAAMTGRCCALNLVRALQLHRKLALGIAAAGLALAVAYVVKSWPVYTAQSQIYVQPVQSKVMAQGDD